MDFDEDEALAAAIAASIADQEADNKAKPGEKGPEAKRLKLSDSLRASDLLRNSDGWYSDVEADEPELNNTQDDDFSMMEFDRVEVHKPYECLTRDDIIAKQKFLIGKVSEFLSVSNASARVLLQFAHWDFETITTLWAEDSEELCKKAGVDLSTKSENASKHQSECTICMDESDDVWSLSCQHDFCRGCWQNYLQIEIKENKQKIKCPGHKCNLILDENAVIELVDDPIITRRFNENLINSFVEDNPFVRWCPAAGCKYAVLLKDISSDHNESILCKCGSYFCFRCREEGHAPVSCDMFKDWNIKNAGGDDALSKQFLQALSRPCPSCGANIEKNGGCNHMTCFKCGYHFCWLCMEKFGSGPKGGTDGYGSHKCNIFGEADKNVAQNNTPKDWERFRWYAERYNNHARSKEIEEKLLRNTEPMRQQMQISAQLSWANGVFYENALAQICMNRCVLKWSYVFGYYRPLKRPDISKDLFEHRQNELERHTEMLARWFDTKKEFEENAIYLAENRFSIINETRLSVASNKALLDVAANAIVQNDNSGEQESAGRLKAIKKAFRKKKKNKDKEKEAHKTAPTINIDGQLPPVLLPYIKGEENQPGAQDARNTNNRDKKNSGNNNNNTGRRNEGGNNAGGNADLDAQHEADLARAMQESLEQDNEAALLALAIAESLKSSDNPVNAADDLDEEMKEAIRRSMLELDQPTTNTITTTTTTTPTSKEKKSKKDKKTKREKKPAASSKSKLKEKKK